ncbi:biotin-dependent carboxyltransferase family protein [Microbacterium sp.]|uniref:5-oxoprolinase subunit C family protein n=1 Tax=Microbacterium sp. TaxID=51671 RepID=UPI003C767286
MSAANGGGTLRVLFAGAAAVTDLGRPRGPRFGVPVGGALDQGSARVANVLVGNPPDAPLLEITAMNLEFVCDADILIAVAGAPMTLTVDGVARPLAEPVSVPAGSVVALRDMTAGLRTYVAAHGSFDVPMLLGSCAPDTVLGFGRRLQNGDELRVRRTPPIVNPWFAAPLYRLHAPGSAIASPVIDVTDGPDAADFGATAARLFRGPYVVGPASNHIGLRLNGVVPERQTSGEVLSRGVPVGAVEVPPGDELLILHRGRGVTAGYPVMAVVTSTSLDALAQARPGDTVRFRRVSITHAVEDARAAHRRIAALQGRVAGVFAALGHEHLIPTQ